MYCSFLLFKEYREKYPNFIYHSYEIKQDNNILNIKYNFEIEGLTTFTPAIYIPLKEEMDLNDELLKYLVFHEYDLVIQYVLIKKYN